MKKNKKSEARSQKSEKQESESRSQETGGLNDNVVIPAEAGIQEIKEGSAFADAMKMVSGKYDESSVSSVSSVVKQPEESSSTATDSTQSRLASLIKITPELMSRVTGYSESTCKKVLLDCYPNRDITEFINQQTSIFLKRVRNVLYNVNLYNALDNAMVGKKIKDPEQMRLFVELQNLNQLLNGGK